MENFLNFPVFFRVADMHSAREVVGLFKIAVEDEFVSKK
jgi:hypothetical protein